MQLPDPPPPLPIARTPVLAYVFALVAMGLIGVVAVLGLEVVRPKQDNSTLIAVILGTLTPTSAALLALISGVNNARAINDLHIIVNSRLSQLLLVTAQSERIQGRAEGRDAVLTGGATSLSTMPVLPIPVQIQQPVEKPVPVVMAPKDNLS